MVAKALLFIDKILNKLEERKALKEGILSKSHERSKKVGSRLESFPKLLDFIHFQIKDSLFPYSELFHWEYTYSS